MKALSIFIFSLLLTTTSCASHYSNNSTYKPSQFHQLQTIQYGEITGLNSVPISNKDGTVATVVGGITGLAIGNLFGSGRGKKAATIVGGLGGALLGNRWAKSRQRQHGVEINIRLDNGSQVSLLQDSGESFRVGQRVKLIQQSNGNARVTRL